jgi:hypothetical protein
MSIKFPTLLVSLIITIFFCFFGFMIYKYFSNFGKNFINDRGSIEVLSINKDIKELIYAIDKLYKENPALKGDVTSDSIIYFNIYITVSDEKKMISYRIIGGEAYKEMYKNMANQPSLSNIEPNQSMIEFFAPEIGGDEREDVILIIKRDFVDKIDVMNSNLEDSFSYDLFFESSNSSWITAFKKVN